MNELKKSSRRTARSINKKEINFFWHKEQGQPVLSEAVVKSVMDASKKDTRIFRRFLKRMYSEMLKEAIQKNIFGQIITHDPVRVGFFGSSLGLKEVRRRIFFDFEKRNPASGIAFFQNPEDKGKEVRERLLELFESFLYQRGEPKECYEEEIIKICKADPEYLFQIVGDKEINSEVRLNAVRIIAETCTEKEIDRLVEYCRDHEYPIMKGGLLYGLSSLSDESVKVKYIDLIQRMTEDESPDVREIAKKLMRQFAL